MEPAIDRILIDRLAIARRVGGMGDAIAADIADRRAASRLVVVPVMTGALVLTADLIRTLPVPMSISLVEASSYPGSAIASTGVRLDAGAPLEDLRGAYALVIDDILDSGRTLAAVADRVRAAGAAQVRTCVLLNKVVRRAVDDGAALRADFSGFCIPDVFVVGYGLDHDGLYRNLPDVAILGHGRAQPDRWRPLVVGLAGAVGAGKSRAARCLADLGMVVSDSDGDVASLFELAEVQGELASLFGPRVVAGGRVDRRAIADRVFADADERRRLEGVLHPRLHAMRRRRLAEASRTGAPGMVVDAPLLFEAGVDRECDLLLFVDTPADQRLERVRRTRGWDQAELARRQAAQMPPDQKRLRCHAVVDNSGDADDLARGVRDALRSAAPGVLEAGRCGGLAGPGGGG